MFPSDCHCIILFRKLCVWQDWHQMFTIESKSILPVIRYGPLCSIFPELPKHVTKKCLFLFSSKCKECVLVALCLPPQIAAFFVYPVFSVFVVSIIRVLWLKLILPALWTKTRIAFVQNLSNHLCYSTCSSYYASMHFVLHNYSLKFTKKNTVYFY